VISYTGTRQTTNRHSTNNAFTKAARKYRNAKVKKQGFGTW
jgi:hypothetical protein